MAHKAVEMKRSERSDAEIQLSKQVVQTFLRGAYCGPSANFQMDNCLLTGACDVLVPFNEYVRKYSLSGADYKLMQLYVERIATFAGGSQ